MCDADGNGEKIVKIGQQKQRYCNLYDGSLFKLSKEIDSSEWV